MPNVRVRLRSTAPPEVRFHLGSGTFEKSFSKEDSPLGWVVSQEEFDKYLKPSGWFELVTEKAPERPSYKALHTDVGRIK